MAKFYKPSHAYNFNYFNNWCTRGRKKDLYIVNLRLLATSSTPHLYQSQLGPSSSSTCKPAAKTRFISTFSFSSIFCSNSVFRTCPLSYFSLTRKSRNFRISDFDNLRFVDLLSSRRIWGPHSQRMAEFSTSPPHNDIYALIGDFEKSHHFQRRKLTNISDSPESEHPPGSPPQGPGRSIYQLLDKVIKYKDKNVSQITIEKATKELCQAYTMLGCENEKLEFFNTLAKNYAVDQNQITSVSQSLLSIDDTNTEALLNIQDKLKTSLIPKYYWLFCQMGRLENGVKFLVNLRTHLLDIIDHQKELNSMHYLKALNNVLRELITMWFSVGFLNLERVTWQSSCDMLQKISEYEAVHPMRNWTDLKRRVGNYRRCFVYTHGAMPSEPIVVLHTALTDHIISNIRSIVVNPRMKSFDSQTDSSTLSEDPSFISTAIFYSVTSTQKGLSGIELGNYLIKRVVRELQSEFPNMNQFSTLSPIPTFKSWLINEFKLAQKPTYSKLLLTNNEQKNIREILEVPQSDDLPALFARLIQEFKVNEWYTNDVLVKQLEVPLIRLCSRYLVLEKRRGYALDGVANFHLKNGAVIWKLNWLGDNSPRGLGNSFSIMVNYRYFIEDCETNSQNYLENMEVKLSDQVSHLVKIAAADMQPQNSKI